jgi:1-acyl-sn-glycerol-3-phosphate acyltransferase
VQIIIRSAIFNALFYVVTILYLIAALPTFVMRRTAIMDVAKSWSRTNTWLLRVICGTRVEYRGLEKIPAGALIVASKHQSLWETFALLPLLPDPVFILKREIMWIPLFGWFTIKGQMIPVDRGKRSQALAAMAEHARHALGDKRQIIIFPEGTRRPAGAEPNYKYGVGYLYSQTGTTCLPIALNSGLFWPRRSFLRYPGTIRLEVLDPIPPGLETSAFMERLQQQIESATVRLIAEGERELAAMGITPVTKAAKD